MDFLSDLNLTATHAFLIFYFVSSAVQAMPKPEQSDGKLYRFAFQFAHIVVANWKVAVKQHRQGRYGGRGRR